MSRIFDPYHPNHYRYRRVDRSEKIKSTDAVFGYIKEVSDRSILKPEGVNLNGYRVRTVFEADWILNSINTPQTTFSSLRSIQSDNQPWQTFKYVPSNLGVGYLFFFVCNYCFRNTLYLYMPHGLFLYLCKDCHRLSYPTLQQKLADLKRIEKLSQ